ncbi:hypothetical protein GCM10010390_30740 [Streptomyces mordarskii]|uniref:Uncharacterized protein n=1 Tax=Streptomyces mordarskii TaxID=1226758 RepID=A0ABN1CTZ4_9ACTN
MLQIKRFFGGCPEGHLAWMGLSSGHGSRFWVCLTGPAVRHLSRLPGAGAASPALASTGPALGDVARAPHSRRRCSMAPKARGGNPHPLGRPRPPRPDKTGNVIVFVE